MDDLLIDVMDWLEGTTADTVISYVIIMAVAGAVLLAAVSRLDARDARRAARAGK